MQHTIPKSSVSSVFSPQNGIATHLTIRASCQSRPPTHMKKTRGLQQWPAMSTHHTHSTHQPANHQTATTTVPLQLRFYIDREQLSSLTRFADRHASTFRVLGSDRQHMPLRPDRPTGLLHALLRAADCNGEVTLEADVDPSKLTKAENQAFTFDRIAWRTFHSHTNAAIPCEEASRGREKTSEHRVADEVFFGPQWNTTAGARIPRNRPYHVVDEGTTDIPDKMYRFEVRAADTGELVCIARTKVGAYCTARRLRLQGIETNIFLGTWERV
ncbi:hypothetical protein FRC0337_01617 [Corynebacterium diphtheriae]|nr:hypothetical protein FRC0337_01617 [Corynebacterium diphtheriae]